MNTLYMKIKKCPNCGTRLTKGKYQELGGSGLVGLKNDKWRGGFWVPGKGSSLGAIWINKKIPIDAYLCKKCGSMQLFAVFEEK